MSTAVRDAETAAPAKKIAIFIVTYNAVSTLTQVLDRIPEEIWEKVAEVFVFDDSSQDDTYLVGLGYKAHHGKAKLTVLRHEENHGYGGNQIQGYKYAIEKGYDIVALLHGDGQYAPEALPLLLEPLEKGEADAVFGSRMMTRGAALEGGMPAYKYVGNKILTSFENALLGMNLSEFHSGYRLYSVPALAKLPFAHNTWDFHFDTQIIIQMHAAGMRIVERPIPTYYGDEICHVDGVRYAKDVVRSVLEFRMHELGLLRRPEYEIEAPDYSVKSSNLSSHSQLLTMVGPPPRTVLDVGCGSGEFAGLLEERGHRVTGIDSRPPSTPPSEFIEGNLAEGLPLDPQRTFDVVVLGDVLEHMAEPERLLAAARAHVAPGGKLLVSLPNAVHWSVRTQVARGNFEYTNRGLLDRGHLRFFTTKTATRLFESSGLRVVEHRVTPIPWERVVPGGPARIVGRTIEQADYLLARLRPGLFAYQNIFELTPSGG
ncbi:MAG: methyltransferase domain-containing protein [Deltaproteobacteria bacterium]|nr:methyltransferase domain-containing protein [Deltaproteobacteria bacterium]